MSISNPQHVVRNHLETNSMSETGKVQLDSNIAWRANPEPFSFMDEPSVRPDSEGNTSTSFDKHCTNPNAPPLTSTIRTLTLLLSTPSVKPMTQKEKDNKTQDIKTK